MSITSDRNTLIVQIIQARGNVKVSELCELLEVSEITVRRCLNDLAKQGRIRRVHGGAVLADKLEDGLFVENRARQNHEVKQRIAVEAAGMVPVNGSVYLDSGSTCLEVAKELGRRGKPYLIITDSLLVLHELYGLPQLRVMLLGGELATDKVTLDGHMATEAAKRLSVDVCMFSANGFTDEQLDNQYLFGVSNKEAIIEKAKRRVFISDSSKYNRLCCFHFCRWEDVNVFVTDSNLPEATRAVISSKGVDVRVVRV